MLYAHSIEGASQNEWQPLEEHLENVSRLAGEFASVFGASSWGSLIGLLHDAGKASPAFQRRLCGSKEQVDHSTAGAHIAEDRYGRPGKSLALLIAGHHGGLPNRSIPGERTPLRDRLDRRIEPYEAYFDLADLPDHLETPQFLINNGDKTWRIYSYSMLMKMLYSCLVDADYLDTEAFVTHDISSVRNIRVSSLSELNDRLRSSMDKKMREAQKTPVNLARAEIYDACVSSAQLKPGLFTLSVPTGGGKTLASLSFAMNHALKYGKQRIIYVIPFTSIVEQTASIFKSILGQDAVLEHHSNYSFSESDDDEALHERLAVQNWDAPIIVTTNVQFFESLYSDKPSRCRKLHNIANSVVILDEAQTLPDGLLKPSLASLEELCKNYSTSVVLCTATQPAIADIWPFGSSPREIVPDYERLSRTLGTRNSIVHIGSMGIDDLAGDIVKENQILCIVSARDSASKLYDAVCARGAKQNLFHLSALMAPAHRSQVISQIKVCLKNHLDCRVISTSLIEAGVDVDFPVVYREMTGIDSILQAAGRCNREGLLATGEVRVFECDEFTSKLSSWMGRMRALGEEITKTQSAPYSEQGVHEFFLRRYQVDGPEGLDEHGIMEELCDFQRMSEGNYSFERYAEEFKFIDDEGVSILVPWGKDGLGLLDELRNSETPAVLARKAQRYTVSVPWYQFKEYFAQGVIEKIGPFDILSPEAGCSRYYTDEKGLLKPGEGEMPSLIC